VETGQIIDLIDKTSSERTCMQRFGKVGWGKPRQAPTIFPQVNGYRIELPIMFNIRRDVA
jgi:hypothetical protein